MRRRLEWCRLDEVGEDDVVDGVKEAVPGVLAFVIQVAHAAQHFDNDLAQLVECFFGNSATLVTFAHLGENLYDLFQAAFFAETVNGCAENRPAKW